jgi:transcriptional regulator with XRE-family HTH domain
MTQKLSFDELRSQAIALRRAGKSRREITEILDIRSNTTLNNALRGEPPPLWELRARAKDDKHEQAREMRARGHTYDEIAAQLGVSKGSVSLWVRDMPRTGRLSYEEYRRRNAEGVARYWASEAPLREARRQAITDAAGAEIGALSDREILIAGAIAYWCEGCKSKPHRPSEQMAFINSDPQLIRFFMRFLTVAGVSPDRLTCRLHIHESADVAAAQRFWLDVTGLPDTQFKRPTLKRHNPRTVRKNTGQDYHGCLIIKVRRAAELYRKVEGWARASMLVQPLAPSDASVLGSRSAG